MSKVYLWIGAALLLVGVCGATVTYAFEGSGAKGLIEFLIAKNIIPADKAEQARMFAEKLDNVTTLEQHASSTPKFATVKVSQLIAFSHRTFNEGDEVQGLLLTVTNESDTTQTFEARRKCQVTYKIFDQSNALVFDSASSTPVCTSGERVTYLMPPHVTRMFEIRHKDSAYHLKPGVYRFELDYPEYGRGDLTVTILKK